MLENIINKLEQVKQDNLMVGYHFEAISSITNYPDMYELGKKSAHMRCKGCDMTPTHYMDAESIEACGYCYKCDELRWELYHDGVDTMRYEMYESGMDPDNPDDVAEFLGNY